MTLGVGMINMTMTPRDPVAYREYIFHDYGNIKTDANGDATLPAMEIINPDFYMVVVFDRSVPHGLGLVSVAPLYVVNYTSDIGMSYADSNMAAKQALNPGDNLMVKVTMPNAQEKEYLYAAFAVPESDYNGKIDVNSTGMISDMNLTVDAFTAHFSGNYNDTIKNASTNASWAKQYVDKNFRNTNMSVAVGSSVGKSLEMPVKINNSAMTGKYMLITAVVDPATLKVVSVGQTTFDVVAPQVEMCASWWLILLLVIIILLVVAIYWLFIRKKE
jgi:methanogen extracellular protein (TIGR04279 family)